MAHSFNVKEARLALEICRYTYAVGVGNALNKTDGDDAWNNYVKKHSQPDDPISVQGEGEKGTSFACVVPLRDFNVVSYMGTQTEFGQWKSLKTKSVYDLLKVGPLLKELGEDLTHSVLSVLDWEQNLEAQPVPFVLDGSHIGKPNGVILPGEVHRGFLDELKAVQAEIVTKLKALGDPQKPVMVTGHSQGGAEAALGTAALTAAGFDVMATYTFAAPRPCNQTFAAGVKTPIYRLEYGNDIVPHLPPSLIRKIISDWAASLSSHKLVAKVIEPVLNFLLSPLQDHGYVGVGPLSYGCTKDGKVQFDTNISAAAEAKLFNDRLKWLTENPQDWADHHHLAGTTAQVKAKQRGNYTSFLMDPQTTA